MKVIVDYYVNEDDRSEFEFFTEKKIEDITEEDCIRAYAKKFGYKKSNYIEIISFYDE